MNYDKVPQVKPTIRELLKLMRPGMVEEAVAERVEAVLQIRSYANDYDDIWKDGYNAAIRDVRRALDGEVWR